MNEPKQFKLPAWVILLDVLGALLLAAGLIVLTGGAGLLDADPDSLKAPAIALIVIGALLMLPLIVVVVARVRSAE